MNTNSGEKSFLTPGWTPRGATRADMNSDMWGRSIYPVRRLLEASGSAATQGSSHTSAFAQNASWPSGSQELLIKRLIEGSQAPESQFATLSQSTRGVTRSAGPPVAGSRPRSRSVGPRSAGTFAPTTPPYRFIVPNTATQHQGRGHTTDEWGQWATFLAERDVSRAAKQHPPRRGRTPVTEEVTTRDPAGRYYPALPQEEPDPLFKEWHDSLQRERGMWAGKTKAKRLAETEGDVLSYNIPQCWENTPDGALCTISDAKHFLHKYTYIPAWVEMARRNAIFFKAILDYYFNHKIWPPFEQLPEDFRRACVREGIRPTLMRKQPGFAPVWVFELKKMDDRYFTNVVNHFFENKTFPPWSTLPAHFITKFKALSLNENKFYFS